jgi:hypothetical protein
MLFVSTILIYTLLSGVCFTAERKAITEPPSSDIDFKDGLLRISVEKQKFTKVMVEVARQAGIRIVILDPADEYLTAHFGYLPLEKSLQRLLKGRNYVFLYRSDEVDHSSKLIQVFVYPKSDKQKSVTYQKKSENEFAEEGFPSEQDFLADLQQALSQHDKEFPKDVSETLKEIQDLEKFEELMQELAEVLQNLPEEGMVTQEQFLDALKGKREMDKKGTTTMNQPQSE